MFGYKGDITGKIIYYYGLLWTSNAKFLELLVERILKIILRIDNKVF